MATAADRVAEDLAQRSRKRPLTLLGCLYVLEGSAHGAKVLRVWTREALDLQGSGGLAYLQGQADSVPDHWQRFCGHLDALPLNERERDTVIDGALATFAGIHRLMEMLHSAPVEPVSGRDAAGLEGRSPQRR